MKVNARRRLCLFAFREKSSTRAFMSIHGALIGFDVQTILFDVRKALENFPMNARFARRLT